jgi:hypothetical protein
MNKFEFTKENAAAVLRSRKVVSVGPQFTGIKVNHVSDAMMDSQGQEYHIVNLAAVTKRQAQFAVKAYNDGDYEAALNGDKTFGRTSLSCRVYPERQPLPMKGDVVNIRLEEVWSENQGANIEVVAALSIPAPIVAKGISLQVEETVNEDMDNE